MKADLINTFLRGNESVIWFNKSGEKTVFGRIIKDMWKKYDDEFKRNALRKVLDDQSVRSVAEELGVNVSLIHRWKRASKIVGDGSRSGNK